MFSKNVENELNEDQQRMIRDLNEELLDSNATGATLSKAFEIYENNQGEIEAREEGRRALFEKDRKIAPILGKTTKNIIIC